MSYEPYNLESKDDSEHSAITPVDFTDRSYILKIGAALAVLVIAGILAAIYFRPPNATARSVNADASNGSASDNIAASQGTAVDSNSATMSSDDSSAGTGDYTLPDSSNSPTSDEATIASTYVSAADQSYIEQSEAITAISDDWSSFDYSRDDQGKIIDYTNDWRTKILSDADSLNSCASEAYHLDAPDNYTKAQKYMQLAANEESYCANHIPQAIADIGTLAKLQDCQRHLTLAVKYLGEFKNAL